MHLARRAAASLITLAPMVAGGAASATRVVDAPAHFVHHVVPAVAGSRDGSASSTNWSGYDTTGSTFTEAQGSWTEPTASCAPGANTAAAFWVGIDGVSSSSVEQDGTDADCDGGTPTYYAWYELYPASSVSLPTAQYPVQPGDVVTSSITNTSGDSFRLTLKDVRGGTTLWTFATTGASSQANESSAEWIAEAPEECYGSSCSLTTLTNFGSVNFTGSETTGSGTTGTISSFSNDAITMVSSSGATEASPSSLSGGGASFTVAYR